MKLIFYVLALSFSLSVLSFSLLDFHIYCKHLIKVWVCSENFSLIFEVLML